MFATSNISKRFFTKNISGPWNYVSGKRCAPIQTTGTMKVTEPATGKVLSDVPISGAEEVANAVGAAKIAFQPWSNVRDTGKPIWEARIDIESCADALEYYGGIVPAITGQHVPLSGGSFAMVTREPFGVVGGIGAWNFPLQTCVWKVAPALACGNTFVYKPSQFTPVTATVLGEILTASGVPDGVFNVIQGEGETGALLCNHPDVKKLSFTGSVPTGIKVMSAAATEIRAVTLELGGKSPLIVFPDAHLVNAVKATLMANFLSQGQVCSNGTRVYVHKDIFEDFTALLVKQTKQLKIGNPFDEDVTVGATIHESHARKVLGYIDGARREGARVLCGGERSQLTGDLAEGWYLQPCVLVGVTPSMKVVKEEVFGSVLCLMEFESEEDVVREANDTPFGLAGAVFTRDIQRGHRVASAIEAGTVWINTYNLYPTEVPFGGFKGSGVGRENGTAAMEHFTHTKTVYVEMGDVDCGPLYK